jgi:hypothetical protein
MLSQQGYSLKVKAIAYLKPPVPGAPGAFILPPGITLVLVPQYNGHRRVAELKIAGRRVKQR